MSWFVVEAQVCKSHGPIHMTLDERIAPLILLSSKRWWHWKIRHVWSENRRCLAVLISRLKLQAHFSAFKQPKRRIKMAALMLPSPTEATIEVKTCMGRCRPPCTIEDHQLLKKLIRFHTSRLGISANDEDETGKSQMGWGHRVTDICYNRSKLFTWNWWGCCQVVSSQFWVFTGIVKTRVSPFWK